MPSCGEFFFLFFCFFPTFQISLGGAKKGWKPKMGNYLIIIFRTFPTASACRASFATVGEALFSFDHKTSRNKIAKLFPITDVCDIKMKSFFIHKAFPFVFFFFFVGTASFPTKHLPRRGLLSESVCMCSSSKTFDSCSSCEASCWVGEPF